ncbi:MAG: hypothetical protein NTW08_07950 [Gammaproteobacteria bacterium]|nr:hypothetical protein [Gammaproteobacteria bacterium]
MNLKMFAQRLHEALDDIDFPIRLDERIEAFTKLVRIPRFKAEQLLNGTVQPEPELLKQIAEELEVTESWLTGKEEPHH